MQQKIEELQIQNRRGKCVYFPDVRWNQAIDDRNDKNDEKR